VLVRQRDKVAHFVRRITQDPHLAEDLAQEAVLKALEGRGCPAEHDAALRWLKRTAYNMWVDIRRRNSVRERQAPWVVSGLDAAEERSSGVCERELRLEGRTVEWKWLRSELPLALRRVPDLYRGLMSDRYLRGRSFREMAQRSGLTEGNIKTRLYRGRKALARILRSRVRSRGIRQSKEKQWT
jgi:RNA polymerase sigma factor (sigma-70 family)